MNKRRISLLTLTMLPIVLGACASTQPSTDPQFTQELVIQRWHRCVDNSLVRLGAENSHIDGLAEHTLVACQGHKDDVLATFPQRLENAVDEMMVQQVYQSSVTHLMAVKLETVELGTLPQSAPGPL